MTAGLPYWRLSAFYFCFFGILGVLAPYWGPYLRTLGFSPAEIGSLVAILHATKIIAPNLWGWLADYTGRRLTLIRGATFVAIGLFAMLTEARSLTAVAVGMALFSFFWNAALPQFEANTMTHLGCEPHRYSRIRLWGSVGFIASVTILGGLTDRLGMDIVPYAALGLFVLLWLISLSVPQATDHSRADPVEGFLVVLRRPAVAAFFVACFLLQASHGPFYAFYSIYLEDNGYRGLVIGALWAVGVIAEIGVFLVMHRLLPRYGPWRLMLVALFAGVLRWTVVALAPGSLALQASAQLLHAATFGIYHAVGIALVDHFFRGRNRGRGQALYSSITFGAGVAFGSLASGWLWTRIGSGETFLVAALTSLLGAAIAGWGLRGVRLGRG